MEFRLLAVGDVVAPSGLSYQQEQKRTRKKKDKLEFFVVKF